jgi:hypothetical protein
MSRTGMQYLRDELRLMTNAGTIDITAGTISYFTEDQLDTIFDRNCEPFTYEAIEPINPQRLQNNVLYWNKYEIEYDHVEQSTGGTAIFILQDRTGGTVSASDYSVDYNKNIITFNSNTLGVDYYVTGFSYDINAAAAEIMQMKANSVSNQFDFSTDKHSVKKSQVFKNYMERADYFRSKSKHSGGHGMMRREDSDVICG